MSTLIDLLSCEGDRISPSAFEALMLWIRSVSQGAAVDAITRTAAEMRVQNAELLVWLSKRDALDSDASAQDYATLFRILRLSELFQNLWYPTLVESAHEIPRAVLTELLRAIAHEQHHTEFGIGERAIAGPDPQPSAAENSRLLMAAFDADLGVDCDRASHLERVAMWLIEGVPGATSFLLAARDLGLRYNRLELRSRLLVAKDVYESGLSGPRAHLLHVARMAHADELQLYAEYEGLFHEEMIAPDLGRTCCVLEDGRVRAAMTETPEGAFGLVGTGPVERLWEEDESGAVDAGAVFAHGDEVGYFVAAGCYAERDVYECPSLRCLLRRAWRNRSDMIVYMVNFFGSVPPHLRAALLASCDRSGVPQFELMSESRWRSWKHRWFLASSHEITPNERICGLMSYHPSQVYTQAVLADSPVAQVGAGCGAGSGGGGSDEQSDDDEGHAKRRRV